MMAWARDWKNGGKYSFHWNFYAGEHSSKKCYIGSYARFLPPRKAILCLLGRLMRLQRFDCIQLRRYVKDE